MDRLGRVNVNQFILRARKWPWKPMGWLVAAAFLTASVSSSFLARYMLPSSPRTPEVGVAMDPAGNMIPGGMDDSFGRNGPTLSESGVNAILQRNLFNSEGAAEDKSKTGGEAEITKTDLPIKLQGTIYGGTPFNGIALMETEGKSNTFLTGDMVLGEATVLEIHQNRVIFDRGGRKEYIDVEQQELVRSSRLRKKPAAAPPGYVDSVAPLAVDPPPPNFKEEGFDRRGEDISTTSAYRDRMLTVEFAKVLQDAKAVPNMVNGELKGFRLERIRKDSIYEKMGFMNNDVIEEINGYQLNDPAGAVKFLNTLRSEKEVEIRYRRNGSAVNKVVHLQ